jgi:hypothetical protein
MLRQDFQLELGVPAGDLPRELRRVSKDQVEQVRIDGDKASWQAWGASHRHGPDIPADWRRYMEAMGGHCLGRDRWHLRMARRPVPAGAVNQYGEPIAPGCGRVVGLETRRGQWLVSRRIAWRSVARATLEFQDTHGAESAEGADMATPALPARAPLARAWTGFNNCTARLTGHTLRALIGRNGHEREDRANPSGLDSGPASALHRPASGTTPYSHPFFSC